MTTLAIDIETYSSADLTKTGVYRYAQDKDFGIMLLAYAWDGGPVQVVDLMTEELPADVSKALTDPRVLKTAYNAAFERTCLSAHLGVALSPEQWECTLVKASMVGLPLGLDMVAKVLKLSQEKDSAGKALIRYFSMPCKPTKANGGRTRNLPEHAPEKWQQFKDYCRQDVVVELAIRDRIRFFTIPDAERRLWLLDQRINDRGVRIDKTLVRNAISQDETYRRRMTAEAVELTGLDNPNSAAQLKAWVSAEMDEDVATLRKTDIPELLAKTDCDVVTRVLQIRQEISKTSVKKYTAMAKALCKDSRVRGLLQYYGANRTGRWAGRLVQVQNLPRNEMKDLGLARSLVSDGDLDLLELLYGNVPDTLSQLVRTAFVPAPGHRFIIADFSAIEARVIAWLAGERWRLNVFNTHGKIYEASAAQMFKVPIESISYKDPTTGETVKGSNYELRQRGKVAELALGYQGGPGALETMGALKMGIPEDDLPRLVKMWRNANKAIVGYWQTVQDAAIAAVQGEPSTLKYGIRFFCDKGYLVIALPSGRMLFYLAPKLRANSFGSYDLYYEGMSQTTKKWCLQQTYGGKLVENIVQAVARDCLADAMLRLDAAGYHIVMHIHDEVVLEMPHGSGSTEDVNRIMGTPIPWAPGLPLKAESYESDYYKKD